MKQLVTAAAIAATLTLAGCAATGGDTTSAAPEPAPATGAEQPLLAAYGLEGRSVVEVVDHLDRLGIPQRPADLKASVRPGELVLTSGRQEFTLDLPDDRFYLSVAPYVDRTHDCFHHSLTTCTGELAATDVQVRIVDETNDVVLVDQAQTTYANGFIGFWLPRNIDATLHISHGDKSGEARISTTDDAPTCLTTLRLT